MDKGSIKFSKQTVQISEKIKRISAKQQKLKKNIDRTAKSISRITKEIENKEASLTRYKKLLETIPAKISELEKVIPEKKVKLDKVMHNHIQYEESTTQLSKDIDKLQETLKLHITRDYTNLVHQVTNENSYYAYLEQNTRTTPIMNKLYNEEADFLIIELPGFNRVKTNNMYEIRFSYVVVNFSPSNILCNNYNATVTDIKKVETNMPFEMRNNAVIILNNAPENKIFEGATFQFEVPYSFKAQNWSHQTGFGNYYEWGELVYEGTKYGDTSKHYVIGFVVNNVYKY